ncbi:MULTISPECIES: hypothetical protein [unclassified Caballeronia]|uniref:hypothetical protein n=1 Tax=unclassified Caballeronia TaxID=2646786 RepID=UPI00285C98EE|nr:MULTISPECIES: hypothetical protein [unclassified Caballeronia]MDR5776310.1 hypothetical protein [Caballeronia sp. LZ002]MDR5851908.1 hypothetical protein [Caballeronia sp. LZ003]
MNNESRDRREDDQFSSVSQYSGTANGPGRIGNAKTISRKIQKDARFGRCGTDGSQTA